MRTDDDHVDLAGLPSEVRRMAALDYRQAVAAVTGAGRLPALLRGRVRAASWDPDLADEIFGYGREITEEHVIDDLLDDLRRA